MKEKNEIERTDLHSYLAGLARRLRFLGHSVTALAEQDWTAGSELSEMGGMLALEADRLGRVAEALERRAATQEVVEDFRVLPPEKRRRDLAKEPCFPLAGPGQHFRG